MPSQHAKTYNSFSGVDITPVFGSVSIGECQGISYSVSREKAPLYTLGSPNPRAFARGKRGIAGGIVFIVFDRSALFDTLSDGDQNFYGNTWEAPLGRQAAADFTKDNKFAQTQGAVTTPDRGSLDAAGNFGRVDSKIDSKKAMKAYYHDQIPPFDVLLFAATERGHGAIMEIYGIEIVNSGSGVSVDDINMDETCTYVAKNLTPWHSQTYNNPADNYGKSYEYNGMQAGNVNGQDAAAAATTAVSEINNF